MKGAAPMFHAQRSAGGRGLGIAGFISAFSFLALTRFIPGCIYIAGYKTDLLLAAALLGLGVGCINGPSHESAQAHLLSFTFRILMVVLAAAAVHYAGSSAPALTWGEVFWSYGPGRGLPAEALMPALFALLAWAYISAGRLLASTAVRGAGHSSLCAGGLAAAGFMAALSLFNTPPALWFAALFAAVFVLLLVRGAPIKGLVLAGSLSMSIILVSTAPFFGSRWSPLYRVSENEEHVWGDIPEQASRTLQLFEVCLNGEYYDFGANLDPVMVGIASQGLGLTPAGSSLELMRNYVYAPFRLRPPGKTLVIGSGLGNGVAAALKAGASSVTAIELDPLVADLGSRHPERPYAHPRVFLKTAGPRRFALSRESNYDLIVILMPLSYRSLSPLSNIRAESFLFTRQGMRDLARLLEPDGVMAVVLPLRGGPVARRLFHLIRSVFPHSTRAFGGRGGPAGDFILAAGGPGLTRYAPALGLHEVTARFLLQPAELPSDIRPYLFHVYGHAKPYYFRVVGVILFIFLALAWRPARREGRRLTPALMGGAAAAVTAFGIMSFSPLALGASWPVQYAVLGGCFLAFLLAPSTASRLPETFLFALSLGAVLLLYLACIHLAGRGAGLSAWFVPAAFGALFLSGLAPARESSSGFTPALGAELLGAGAAILATQATVIYGLHLILFLAAFFASTWFFSGRRR